MIQIWKVDGTEAPCTSSYESYKLKKSYETSHVSNVVHATILLADIASKIRLRLILILIYHCVYREMRKTESFPHQ